MKRMMGRIYVPLNEMLPLFGLGGSGCGAEICVNTINFDFFDLASRKRIKSQPAVSCRLPEMEGVGSLGSLESWYNPPTKLKKGEFPKIEIFRHPSSTAILNS